MLHTSFAWGMEFGWYLDYIHCLLRIRDKHCCRQLRPPTVRYLHPPLDSGALLYHGAVFQLNFGHLNIGNLDFIPAWIMVQSRPNLREESFLSTFGEVMLLHLMPLLQFCQSCLHRFWSCGTTQQVVGDVGVIASKNICGPVKAVIR